MDLPVGQRESQVLEFKARDGLKDRLELAREVVAFLNANGGDLYVGLREDNEIAVEVEPIENADREAGRLRDSLVDTIDPSPSPGEVEIAVVSDDAGHEVIRVRVRKGAHRPYAVAKGDHARRYHIRIGSRLREMTREELADAFSAQGKVQEDPLASLRRRLLQERDERQKRGEDEIWCAIQPVRDVSLNTRDPKLATLLSDRQAIGVDPEAPSFHVPFEPEPRQDRLVAGIDIPGQDKAWSARLKQTTVREDGGIRFHAVLQLLYRHATGSTSRVVNPEVLIGVLVSLLRLAGGALAEVLGNDDKLVVDLALFGVGREEALLFPGRWRLPRPGREAHAYEDGDDLTLTRPPDFSFREVRDAPERCVFRLLALVYEAFGWREDAIPMDFDPRTGRAKVPA